MLSALLYAKNNRQIDKVCIIAMFLPELKLQHTYFYFYSTICEGIPSEWEEVHSKSKDCNSKKNTRSIVPTTASFQRTIPRLHIAGNGKLKEVIFGVILYAMCTSSFSVSDKIFFSIFVWCGCVIRICPMFEISA